MQTAAKSKNSKIILALDLPFDVPQNRGKVMDRAQKILEAVHPYVCAVKINHHLTLPLGLFDGVEKLVEQIRGEGMLAIMDAKVNDIGNTNQVIAEYYYAAGFDAIIANPFVGWDEGLKPLFEVSRKLHRGVILLNYMSHKGAVEGYGQTVLDADTCEHIPQYVAFARKAVMWGADGVVVGATVLDKVKEIKQLLKGKVEIYSPGVGAQGGAAETAIMAGSDYLIVGREITSSDNPEQAARRLYDSIKGL